MLKSNYYGSSLEAGCDEAGRGCLAGPVFATAVILPYNYKNKDIDDSKKLSAKKRNLIRQHIEKDALSYSIALCTPEEIDEINILNASILAMHRAVSTLNLKPALLLIDGNRFHPFNNIKHVCVVRGDSIYLSIAAASILAKTYRDQFMEELHQHYPDYRWNQNKGYPTEFHRKAISLHGTTPFHRKSFNMANQIKIPF